ncbi:MAG: phosphonate metabolism protein/1,5-bisphosphokinase (PRPP-forming) PhnN [Alsobacter sp.]
MSPDPAGALVAVVGPSGVGKDTLIRLAQQNFRDNPRVSFPRRVVTRPSGADEDHESLSVDGFAEARAAGAFALDWDAHGLSYGIPMAVLAAVRDGGVAVVNLSRGALPAARERFPAVVAVFVTAPAEVLAARLAARGRAESVSDRLARTSAVTADAGRDVVIENVGPAETAAARLIAVITGRLGSGIATA